MTDHPLTDEMIDVLWDKTRASKIDWDEPIDSEVIRAAYDLGADQQLEQVKKKVETKLSEWRRWPLKPCDDIEDFFYYVMQELRPQEDYQ